MELRDYFSLIWRYKYVVLLTVIIATLAAFILTKFSPTTYTASTTVTVNKTNALKQSQVNYYLYDNYYNVQSAGLFSQIVAQWFSSPSFVKEIYQNANLAIPEVSDKALAKVFNAVWVQPATINISTLGTDNEQLNKLITSAIRTTQQETDKLGKNSDSAYEIASFTPVVIKNQANLKLNTGVGFVSGLILGVVVVLGIAYFRREEA